MEIWKDIKGFEGCYQISSLGRVKSLARNGSPYGENIRKLSRTKDGYLKVRLFGNGKDVTTRVHRLVAETFIENPDNKETVNHIDGNKENNSVENLEWADRHEQLYHAYELGLRKPMAGHINSQSKLTEEQVREIRATYVRQSKEFGTVALSKKYGVTNRVIGLVVNGKAYKNVT